MGKSRKAEINQKQDVQPQGVVESLPLQNMNYTGEVDGLQARMKLELDYDNKLDKSLEAIFTFPLPSEAVVLDVKMKIGERTVNAELKRRDEAKREYEEARDAGHHASLMEEERPNIFTMSVGGIEPGEKISVAVEYMHPVDWQASGGRFTVPLVVAPRFIPGVSLDRNQGGGSSPDTDEVPDASRITPRVAESVDYSASLNLKLTPGFEAHVESPSHEMIIEECDLEANEPLNISLKDLRPDRDLTIVYRTNSELPRMKADRTVLVAGEEQKPEEFTMIQLVPGQAAAAKPLEAILVLDCSGSMAGAGIDGLKVVARKVLERLPQHQGSAPLRVGIVAFNDTAQVLMSLSDIREMNGYSEVLESLQGEGGTRTGPALDRAMSMFSRRDSKDIERAIVLISDGDTEAIHFTRRPDVRVHSVGLSSAINDAFLKEAARSTGGQTYWIRPGEDYDRAAGQIVSLLSGPVVRNVKINGLPADAIASGVQDLYAARPTTIAIRSHKLLENCTITGVAADGSKVEWEIPRTAGETSRLGAVLWAKMRQRELDNPESRAEISLRYGVLGRETAFVAVSEKAVPGEKPVKVEIPVLLPQGWDYDAVFGRAGSMMTRGAMVASSARLCAGPVMKGFHYDAIEENICGIVDEVSYLDADLGSVDELTVDYGHHHSRSSSALPPPRHRTGVPSVSVPPSLPGVPSLGQFDNLPEVLRDAKILLDNLKAGLRTADSNSSFAKIGSDLKQEAASGFSGWSEEHRAELFLTLVELRSYGFKLDIPQELRGRPQDVRSEAGQLWTQAQQSLGIDFRA